MPRMTMTTRSSTRVKPSSFFSRRFFRLLIIMLALLGWMGVAPAWRTPIRSGFLPELIGIRRLSLVITFDERGGNVSPDCGRDWDALVRLLRPRTCGARRRPHAETNQRGRWS